MIRWNISHIFFLGVSGQRRDVTLEPGAVNIITGASGTGKSRAVQFSSCDPVTHGVERV